jgi:hypothetical protein
MARIRRKIAAGSRSHKGEMFYGLQPKHLRGSEPDAGRTLMKKIQLRDNFHASLVVPFRGAVQMGESQAMENERNQRRRLSVFYVPASQWHMKRSNLSATSASLR